MIYTITLNPAVDKTVVVDTFHIHKLNRIHNGKKDAGGKGINVSKTIAQLERESIACGLLAGNSGKFIREELHELKIETLMIEIDGNTRENLKIIDSNGNLTELNEIGPSASSRDVNKVVSSIAKNAKKEDVVVICGSIPSGLQYDIYAVMIQDLKRNGVRVILDADGKSFVEALDASPYAVKPNLHELSAYFNCDETFDKQRIIDQISELHKKGIQLVVVSLGKDGAIFSNGNRIVYAPGLKVEARSSVGAGDAMVAAMAIALEEAMNFDELVILSMACSAGAVLSAGTSPADYETVLELMKQVDFVDWIDTKEE